MLLLAERTVGSEVGRRLGVSRYTVDLLGAAVHGRRLRQPRARSAAQTETVVRIQLAQNAAAAEICPPEASLRSRCICGRWRAIDCLGRSVDADRRALRNGQTSLGRDFSGHVLFATPLTDSSGSALAEHASTPTGFEPDSRSS